MINYNDVYIRIQEQIKKSNLTKEAFTNQLGLKKSPLTDWKNHHSKPTLEQVDKMCEMFAVTFDYLLFGRSNSLSKDEKELMDTYDKLDRRGQHRVHTVIYEELDRMKQDDSEQKNNKNISIQEEERKIII